MPALARGKPPRKRLGAFDRGPRLGHPRLQLQQTRPRNMGQSKIRVGGDSPVEQRVGPGIGRQQQIDCRNVIADRRLRGGGHRKLETVGPRHAPSFASCGGNGGGARNRLWPGPSAARAIMIRCCDSDANFHELHGFSPIATASSDMPVNSALGAAMERAMLPSRFETPRLVLRPIEHDDAAAIFSGYARDPEVVRYLTWRPHQSLADTEAFIERCLAAPAASERTYMLVDRGNGRGLGAFGLRRPAGHRLDCGYVLSRAYWGARAAGERLGCRYVAPRAYLGRGLKGGGVGGGGGLAMRQAELWRIG